MTNNNALTTLMHSDNLPAVTDDQLANAISTTVNDAGGAQTGVTYLSFSGKKGEYSYGRKKTEIEESQLFLLEPAATIAGWTCWKDSKAAAKHSWTSVAAGADPSIKVRFGDLEEFGPYRSNSGDGWKPMLGIGLIDIDELEVSIEFSSTATSAINGMKDLLQECAARLRKHEPAVPIIWLGRETFIAQGNENWKPNFNVEVWATREALEAYIAGKLTREKLLEGKQPRKKRGS